MTSRGGGDSPGIKTSPAKTKDFVVMRIADPAVAQASGC